MDKDLKQKIIMTNFVNKVSNAMKTYLEDGGDYEQMVQMLRLLADSELSEDEISKVNRSTWQELKIIDPARKLSVDHTRKF